MEKLLLSIDVESDGLLGEAFAVGAVVINQQTASIIDQFEGKIDIKLTSGFVKKEVLPKLKTIKTFENQEMLDLAFYSFYKKYSSCEKLVDAGFPVETNFLRRVFNRVEKPIMPYPLYDLISVLRAKNLDPMLDRFKYLNIDLKKHHPKDDALASGLVYLKLLKE